MKRDMRAEQDKLCRTCGGKKTITLKTTKGVETRVRCPACSGRGHGYATK